MHRLQSLAGTAALSVSQFAVDIGELPQVTDVQTRKLGPGGAGAGGQLGEGGTWSTPARWACVHPARSSWRGRCKLPQGRSTSADRLACLARCRRLPDIPDRLTKAAPEEGGLRSQDPSPGPDPGAGGAARGAGTLQRPDRPGDGPAPGHATSVAKPVLPGRPAGPGRRQTLRAPRPVHPGAGRRGQGPGLPVTGRDRHPAVALVVPRTGRRTDGARHHRPRLGVHRAPLATPGRASSPGSTSPGSSSATLPSEPRPSGSWTCMPAPWKANRSARTSTSSARTRRPPSRPAAAATPPWPPGRPARCG